MSTPNKRLLPGLTFAQGLTTEVKLAKGFLERGVILSGNYSATVAVADALAVRAFPIPIASLSLISDGGKVLHSVKPADLIREQQVYEQTPLAAMLPTVPSGFTIAGSPYTGSFELPLSFRSLFAVQGDATDLPSWMYDELTLRVEWGGVGSLFVPDAGTVSVITMTRLDVVQDGLDFAQQGLGDPFQWGRNLLRSLRSFKEAVVTAVADQNFTIELPRTADVRAIVIFQESGTAGATLGEPIGTLINYVTLQIDNALNKFNRVPFSALRGDNAKLFGAPLPTGMAVLEFAEDGDILPPNILPARAMTALNLIIDKAAIAGTIRVMLLRVEPFSQ
jgi:hypothetical protein